ncbi:MAG: pyridoxamine 5'-phosphate oxidase family protein [Spirochaetota bacterium]
MRRKEFELKDSDEIEGFLRTAKSGVLSLCEPDGQPYGVPVNFAYHNGDIVFHSSSDGKKADVIRSGSKAQFTVYREYSIIPSYFTDDHSACHATAFFASVMISGTLYEENDLTEKARALNALMDQLQGGGRFTPISEQNEMYARMLKHTAVFTLKTESISAKYKFGQNLKNETADIIISRLEESGLPLDLETAEMMKKMRREL